jgi:hypothetical protein
VVRYLCFFFVNTQQQSHGRLLIISVDATRKRPPQDPEECRVANPGINQNKAIDKKKYGEYLQYLVHRIKPSLASRSPARFNLMMMFPTVCYHRAKTPNVSICFVGATGPLTRVFDSRPTWCIAARRSTRNGLTMAGDSRGKHQSFGRWSKAPGVAMRQEPSESEGREAVTEDKNIAP